MRRRFKILLIGVLVAAAAVGGYLAYDGWQEKNTGNGIILYGNIDVREGELAFNIGGRVAEMLVEEGDQVERGQLLARLETDILEAEVRAARARVSASQSSLNRLLAGTRTEEIEQARAQVKAVEARLLEARATLRRTVALESRQFASAQQLDVDRSRVRALEAELNAAKQTLELAIQGPRAEDIAEAQARLEAERAALDLAQHRLGYTELYAKNTGVVKTRMVEPGTVVSSQSPVYAIAVSDPVWVRAYIPEPQLAKLVPGAAALVFTDSAPNEPYEGWVGYVSPTAEFTPRQVQTEQLRTSLVYRVRIYVRNPDYGLRQGMPVTVKISPEEASKKTEAALH